MAPQRGRSPKRAKPRYVDLKCYGPDRRTVLGISLPAHGMLMRHADAGSVHLRVADHGDLSGIFFSKVGGHAQVAAFLRRGILTASQARYARRAINQSRLPERDTPSVHTFRHVYGLMTLVPRTPGMIAIIPQLAPLSSLAS